MILLTELWLLANLFFFFTLTGSLGAALLEGSEFHVLLPLWDMITRDKNALLELYCPNREATYKQ